MRSSYDCAQTALPPRRGRDHILGGKPLSYTRATLLGFAAVPGAFKAPNTARAHQKKL
jgi:hypothetical protein